jgi:hypothetical protein
MRLEKVVEITPYISIVKNPSERHPFVHGENRISESGYIKSKYNIDQVSTKCNLGGYRDWLVCPFCNSRRLSLYYDYEDKHFKCRICAELVYDMQTQSKSSRDLFRSVLEPLKVKYRVINNSRPTYNGEFTKRTKKLIRDYEKHFGKPMPLLFLYFWE